MNLKTSKPFTRFALVAACLLLTLTGNAQVRRVYDLRTPIAKRSKIKYIDLAKLVFPDARIVKTTVHYPSNRETTEYYTEGSRSIPLPNAFKNRGPFFLKREFRIDAVDSLVIWTAEGDRLLLHFSVTPFVYLRPSKMDEDGNPIRDETPPARDEELEQSYVNVLAAFRVDKKPGLIDAVDVRKSEATLSVDLFAPLLVKTDVDGFLVHNRQKGIRDNFSSYSLFGLEDGRLKLLFDGFPDLMTQSQCDSDFEDIATYWDSAIRGSDHRKIWMRLVRTENLRSKDCKRVIGTRTKTQRYSANWNKTDGKYYLKVEPPPKRRRS